MRTVLALCLLLAMSLPVSAGGVAVLSTSLTDNGDDDGFPDTDETVTLFLTLKNTSGVALTDVTATLYALQPEVTCLSTPQISVGSLAVDEVVTPAQGFVFTVSDIDRTTLGLSPYDDLSANFQLSFDSASGPVPAHSHKLSFDLDLDVSGGGAQVSDFLENFEGTGSGSLGAFEVQNLDVGLASLAASDGYRCQYNDPDAPNSNFSPNPNCFVGPDTTHNANEFWGLSGPSHSPAGGRGFSGFHSAFFGIDLGPPDNWTTPLSVLEAIGMTDPVHIAADAVAPTLTFVHQCSLADGRDFSLPTDQTYDRGVVAVQVADNAGNPVGPWYKIDPWQNPYDQQNAPVVINCGWDPIDDGSTEDDFHAPTQPGRRYGPSSTCYPEFIFANIGETSDPFDAANIGRADGPGLQGLWGIGTWAESKIDLSRFRGRSIRARFLATALEANSTMATSWVDVFNITDPISGDDGWWIDVVQISELVASAATVVADTKDNSSLPDVGGTDTDSDGLPDTCDNCPASDNADQDDGDLDTVGDACDVCVLNTDNFDPDLDGACGNDDNCPFVANPFQTDFDNDGFGEACDCDDTNSSINPDAVETNDGVDQNCTGDTDEISGMIGFFDSGGDKTLLSWPAQAGANRYHVAWSTAVDFSVDCTLSQTGVSSATVAAIPGANEVDFYVVRSFGPNVGSWGLPTAGPPRTVACAP